MKKTRKAADVSVEELMECLVYNHETGVFLWKKDMTPSVAAGSIAGGVDSMGYLRIGIRGAVLQAGRAALAMFNGKMPVGIVDHINHNPLDNRICNLREVTSSGNSKNRRLSVRNTSGITGVRFLNNRGVWDARIFTNGRLVFLGLFGNLFDAACARKSAEVSNDFHENHGKKK